MYDIFKNNSLYKFIVIKSHKKIKFGSLLSLKKRSLQVVKKLICMYLKLYNAVFLTYSCSNVKIFGCHQSQHNEGRYFTEG